MVLLLFKNFFLIFQGMNEQAMYKPGLHVDAFPLNFNCYHITCLRGWMAHLETFPLPCFYILLLISPKLTQVTCNQIPISLVDRPVLIFSDSHPGCLQLSSSSRYITLYSGVNILLRICLLKHYLIVYLFDLIWIWYFLELQTTLY